MPEYHVLNLGAGVQSTALYLMAMEGFWGLKFDAAIFADTKNEPSKVYNHLQWLRTLNGPPILTDCRGNLLDDLIEDLKTSDKPTNERFVSIPCYTKGSQDKREGITRRQCTREYKTSVVEMAIRYQLLGMKPGQRMAKDVVVNQYFGITTDEARRSVKILDRLAKQPWARGHFPFIDQGWSRTGVKEWLKGRTPHEVPRSACKICPLRNNYEWAAMKRELPDEFEEACQFDDKLREPGKSTVRGGDRQMFLHRSCIPLRVINFGNLPPQQLDGFTLYDCSGACGN